MRPPPAAAGTAPRGVESTLAATLLYPLYFNIGGHPQEGASRGCFREVFQEGRPGGCPSIGQPLAYPLTGANAAARPRPPSRSKRSNRPLQSTPSGATSRGAPAKGGRDAFRAAYRSAGRDVYRAAYRSAGHRPAWLRHARSKRRGSRSQSDPVAITHARKGRTPTRPGRSRRRSTIPPEGIGQRWPPRSSDSAHAKATRRTLARGPRRISGARRPDKRKGGGQSTGGAATATQPH